MGLLLHQHMWYIMDLWADAAMELGYRYGLVVVVVAVVVVVVVTSQLPYREGGGSCHNPIG